MKFTMFLPDVLDKYTRENFRNIKSTLEPIDLLLSDFKFYEFTQTSNETFTIPHSLGYTPKDVIQTSITGTGSWTWNYELFNDVSVSVTTAGIPASTALTVRAFIGKHP